MNNIDLDNYIKVQLNDKGKQIISEKNKFRDNELKIDNNGNLIIRLLDFINLFQDNINNKNELPYTGKITLLDKDKIDTFTVIDNFLKAVDNIYTKSEKKELNTVSFRKKLNNNGIVSSNDFIIEKDIEASSNKEYYYYKDKNNNKVHTIVKDNTNNQVLLLSNGKTLVKVIDGELVYCQNDFKDYIKRLTDNINIYIPNPDEKKNIK